MGPNRTNENRRRRYTRNIHDDIREAQREVATWEQKLDSANQGLGLAQERLGALEAVRDEGNG